MWRDINTSAKKQARCGAILPLALSLPFFFGAPLFADDDIIHTVKSGETVYGLAREYDVKVEEILFINGIDDARKIQSGQRLRIPSTPAMVPPINPDPNAPAVALHRVQKGETLFGIARQYGLPIQELRSLNNLSETYVLKSGDVLKIPLSAQNTVQTTAGSNLLAEQKPASQPINIPQPVIRTVDLSLVWPVKPKRAAYMTGKLSGVALIGEAGESVYCVLPGTVQSAGPYRGFGRVVIVKSEDGYLYVYGGCETLFVKAGDFVTTGMELGRLGVDAVSEQAALFFMVYLDNNPIDPAIAPRG
ncbi:MAG: M23 family metallopeptidase [Spirochaetaceae bacterium]|jgi:murein DD-endopeptidase MepM/ murein hydrolase activator NlpD|nr:M23 family metallopeptidase [Spirochaetaceae bacterium]